MSVENMRSTMHIDPKRDVLYSIPDSDNHGDLLIRPQGSRMKKCIIERGDIVHIRPYVNHGYRYLEENTIWREMFQDMDMYNCVEDKHVHHFPSAPGCKIPGRIRFNRRRCGVLFKPSH